MSQLGVGRVRTESKSGASLDNVSSWPEQIRQATRAVVSKKKNRAWMEQAELFPSTSVRVVAVDIPETQESVAVETPVPFVEVKQLRDPKPREPRAVRSTASPKPVTRAVSTAPLRNQSVPFNTIARFLNVNGAIEGMKTGGIRFDLPGRGLSQTLRLWRGSPEITTFNSVHI